MSIVAILCVPLIIAALSLAARRLRAVQYINSMGHLINLALTIYLVGAFLPQCRPILALNFIYADALSVFFVLTISVVTFATALYSHAFIAEEVRHGRISERKAKIYYILFNLFIFSMLFSTTVNNMGFTWVAIEMTTLVTTFLVGFENSKNSVEAAWKYIIICSVGITLALLGTILFSYALLFSTGIKSVNWTDMMGAASRLDPGLVKIAFIFILVGYGTKAGLAPMHTWLPDAHSQAVSPASALLSGLLLKTAIFPILRFSAIAGGSIGFSYSGHLFILFGLMSLALASGLILAQKDLKRLLAYSSIEHIGIIFLGLGIGGKIGVYGALLHIFNHAATKSILFLGAGRIVSAYGTHNMKKIRGAISALPFTGTIFLLATFAISGFPPFSVFRSEMIILLSAFQSGSYIIGALALLFIAVVFSAMIYHFGDMLFGKKPDSMPAIKEALPIKLALAFLFIVILVSGLAIPAGLNNLITSAANAARGI